MGTLFPDFPLNLEFSNVHQAHCRLDCPPTRTCSSLSSKCPPGKPPPAGETPPWLLCHCLVGALPGTEPAVSLGLRRAVTPLLNSSRLQMAPQKQSQREEDPRTGGGRQGGRTAPSHHRTPYPTGRIRTVSRSFILQARHWREQKGGAILMTSRPQMYWGPSRAN